MRTRKYALHFGESRRIHRLKRIALGNEALVEGDAVIGRGWGAVLVDHPKA